MRHLFFLFFLANAFLIADGEPYWVGVYAVHMPTGKVLIDENGDKSFIPASSMKVITAAAALDILGSDCRFETRLEYDGFIDAEGVLEGNIYIRGGGDPCLGSDRFDSYEKVLESWSVAIAELGIKTIRGRVIGDDSLWEKGLAVPSWSFEDLGNYYGAGASALSFHENSYDLYFRPGKEVGDKTEIARVVPPNPMIHFVNEVTTGPIGSGDRACIYGVEYSLGEYVRGTIPFGVSEFSIKGAIPDPASFTASALHSFLVKRGIPVQEKFVAAEAKRTPFHATFSPPFKEIIYWMNQKSINLYAEHLLKKMGEVVLGHGSTLSGIKAVQVHLKSQNVDLTGMNIADGSGLSRKNLVTPKQFVTLLVKMKASPHFPIFYESLPSLNETLRAKSGYLSLISAQVGYQGDIAFAILINQCTDSKQASALTSKHLRHIASLDETKSCSLL